MGGFGPKLRLIVSVEADGSDVGLIYYLCKVWLDVLPLFVDNRYEWFIIDKQFFLISLLAY